MSVVEQLESSPERGPFATPRPDMRGRYLIRNPRIAAAFAAMDAGLSLLPRRAATVPAAPERILLANWAHLGDVTTTLGAARWLREQFPQARLGMIVGAWGRAAAAQWGLIDDFHIVDHWTLNRSDAGRAAKLRRYRDTRAIAIRAIAAARYQVAIDFYPFFPPAHPLFRAAGVPVRVGFDSGGWGPLLTHAVRWPDREQPIADHYAALVEAVWPDRPVTPGAFRPRLDRLRLPASPVAGRYLVLHPSAGAATRDWGRERWRELVMRLKASPEFRDHRIVLTGAGAKDEGVAADLATAAPGVVSLAGRVDWDGFLATLAGAELVVCPDTVTAHLAAALDTPLVTVFTGIVKPAQWGAYADDARVLVQAVRCAPCNRWGCEAMACIRQTTADDVMRAIGRLPGRRD